MPKGSFDYGHSCPDIDRKLDSAVGTLTSILDDGELKDRDIETVLADLADEWRAINANMREAASDQIDNLTYELDELREKVAELEALVSRQEITIEDLEAAATEYQPDNQIRL